MGAKPSRNPAIGGGTFNARSFVGGLRRSAEGGDAVLQDINQHLKTIELSNGDILTTRNACALLNKFVVRDAQQQQQQQKQQRKQSKSSSGGKNENSKDLDLCIHFMERNLRVLIQCQKGRQQLLTLSRPALVMLLQRDGLVLRGEYELLLFVFAWANARQKKHVTKNAKPKAVKRKKESAVPPPNPHEDDDMVAQLLCDSLVTDEDTESKIDLRDSAALFSQLSSGAHNLQQTKLRHEAEAKAKADAQAKAAKDAKDAADAKAAKERQEAESSDDESSGSEDELETETDIPEDSKMKSRLHEIKKRLQETQLISEGSAEDPTKTVDNKETTDEELVQQQEATLKELDGPNIDIRGTAGLFNHMSRGAIEHKKSSSQMVQEKQQQNTEEVLHLIALINEESETEGWEMDLLPLPFHAETSVGVLPATTPAKDAWQDSITLTPEQESEEYIAALVRAVKPLLKYIRFASLSTYQLQCLAEEGIIPPKYIYNAHRVRYYKDVLPTDEYTELFKNDPVAKRRRFVGNDFKWDPLNKSPNINVKDNGLTVEPVAATGCAHKSILATEGFECGRVIWVVTLNQNADCYSAVGVTSKDSFSTAEVLGTNQYSYAFSFYPGSHVPALPRRTQAPRRLSPGDKVRVDLDMDQGRIEFYLNDVSQHVYTGLTGIAYPAMTVCESAAGGYTTTFVDV
eukprot:TRINITY_DN2958_c0_g2_i2.p1 TRINITY_DN2958_c0_g2~~TRINITY_DN2958_c0_g2_i2.p1  ORF type:complete len:687 (+),score=142.78 TRINITY_DN2958_c0_g2_i2:2-2062(+)